MKTDRDIPIARKRLRASAWLTLLSLGLVQLSLAGHQFDHHATDLVEDCEICVQLERLDDAASGTMAPDAAITVVFEAQLLGSAEVTDPTRVEAYRPRDPPIS